MLRNQFIDLFAGCGGLSLGLAQGGWRGLFAIERDPMAFDTFATNFLANRSAFKFAWPMWLEKSPWQIEKLLQEHGESLRRLRGEVQLVAGGPPCQGFSFAGQRRKLDPRNSLFKKYVEVIDLVRPKVLLVENVLGMKVAHGVVGRRKARTRGRPPEAHSDRLIKALSSLNYDAAAVCIDASEFGVPQRRPRLFVFGVDRDAAWSLTGGVNELIARVERSRRRQLIEFGLKLPVTCRDALGDLETARGKLRNCTDPSSGRGFQEPDYKGPQGRYQFLVRGTVPAETLDSARLARHTPRVQRRFERILEECRRGVAMHSRDRVRFGIRKQRIVPMSRSQSAPTVTTLPDDILHYSEPRILSVRECARLQSFPDWFCFRGKYTTGGIRRTRECPRYTQVGNAVPPFVGRAIAVAIAEYLSEQQETPITLPRLAVG